MLDPKIVFDAFSVSGKTRKHLRSVSIPFGVVPESRDDFDCIEFKIPPEIKDMLIVGNEVWVTLSFIDKFTGARGHRIHVLRP